MNFGSLVTEQMPAVGVHNFHSLHFPYMLVPHFVCSCSKASHSDQLTCINLLPNTVFYIDKIHFMLVYCNYKIPSIALVLGLAVELKSIVILTSNYIALSI